MPPLDLRIFGWHHQRVNKAAAEASVHLIMLTLSSGFITVPPSAAAAATAAAAEAAVPTAAKSTFHGSITDSATKLPVLRSRIPIKTNAWNNTKHASTNDIYAIHPKPSVI